MTGIGQVLTVNFIGLVLAILGLWAGARAIRDVSFVDAFWPLGMVLLAWGSALQAGFGGQRTQLILALVTLWGLRLAVHLFLRWRAQGEDPRYRRILEAVIEGRGWSWGQAALLSVFLTQAPLLFITCLPAQIGVFASATGLSADIGWLARAGVLVAIAGIVIESIADAQLHAFRRHPANRGKVLDTGLWRYTRHPNYFGDALVWWGLWLLAAGAGLWVAAASLIGPVFLTFTLTRWSGVPTLELGLRRTRPGYADYAARTSGFLPWPPKAR